jgi:Tfp pilus assembly protein PilE
MTYDFLIKAQAQPDLKDFCDYVKKPLMVLDDILYRYKELQLAKKVEQYNLETYHKCDVILQKHLPEMVDNFCNFSFDYRNNKKIQVSSNTLLTPKELLLKNLAKVIEEVEVIEKDFNRNNSFNAVVQNKILEQYGYQPELCLETGKVVKSNIELDNKFDYEKFVEKNEFKKPKVESIKKEEPKKVEEVKEEVATRSGGGISMIELSLVLTIVGLLGGVTYSMYKNTYNEAQKNRLTENILNLERGVKTVYANHGDYKGINNTLIIDSYIAKKEFLVTPWGNNITVNPATIEKQNDAFAIEIELTGKENDTEHSTACLASLNVADSFAIIKLGDTVVKNQDYKPKEQIMMDCVTHSYDKVTLISK